VALGTEVISQSNNNLLDLLSKLTGGSEDKGLAFRNGKVEALEDTNGEGSSLTGT